MWVKLIHNGVMCYDTTCYLGLVMNTSARETLGQALYRLRTAQEWSREALARQSHVSAMTITRLENDLVDERTGKINAPKPDTLRKLAIALGHRDKERAEAVRRELFDAAGYGAEVPDEPESSEEVKELGRRLHVLERRLETEPAVLTEMRHLVESAEPQHRERLIRMLEEFLARVREGSGHPE